MVYCEERKSDNLVWKQWTGGYDGNDSRSAWCEGVSRPTCRSPYEQSKISDKSFGTPSHFCNICQGNLSVRPLPPNSMLFIVVKSSLPACNIVGGKGVPYANDVIRYCPQNTLSTHFRGIWSRCAKDFCRGLYLDEHHIPDITSHYRDSDLLVITVVPQVTSNKVAHSESTIWQLTST